MGTVTTMVIVILRVNGLIAAPETALAPPVLAILATFVAWFRYSSNVICRVFRFILFTSSRLSVHESIGLRR